MSAFVILERKDLLGCAQTGTGKTAAFALPLLQLLCEDMAGIKEETRPGNPRPMHVVQSLVFGNRVASEGRVTPYSS